MLKMPWVARFGNLLLVIFEQVLPVEKGPVRAAGNLAGEKGEKKIFS
jgi:hypothetical protein